MSSFMKIVVGLIVIAFSLPFLGSILAAVWSMFWGFLAFIILVGLIVLTWQWVIKPACRLIGCNRCGEGSHRGPASEHFGEE